jgi:hypothetical protein
MAKKSGNRSSSGEKISKDRAAPQCDLGIAGTILVPKLDPFAEDDDAFEQSTI